MDGTIVKQPLSEEDAIASQLKVQPSENPYVLGRIVGPFMVAETDNGNGRFYLRETIKKGILENPYVINMMANKSLLGESHHPTDRTSIWSEKTCISTTKLWMEGNILMGDADILDTPTGRVIWNLARYGTHLGISARANGTGVKKGGHLVIKPENYYFRTFDVVLNPGFKEARPNILMPDASTSANVSEEQGDISLDTLFEELRGMIVNKTGDSETIKTYISYSGSDKLATLLPLLEEDTSLHKTDTSVDITKLQEELESLRAYKQNSLSANLDSRARVKKMMRAKDKLEEELGGYKDKVKVLQEEITKGNDESTSMSEELLGIIENSQKEIVRLKSELESKNEELELLSSDKRDLQDRLLLSEDLVSQYAGRVSKTTKTISSLREEVEDNYTEHSPKVVQKINLNKGKVVLNEEKEDVREVATGRVALIKSVGGL